MCNDVMEDVLIFVCGRFLDVEILLNIFINEINEFINVCFCIEVQDIESSNILYVYVVFNVLLMSEEVSKFLVIVFDLYVY